MIKNCIIYRIAEKYKSKLQVDKRALSAVTLKRCLEEAKGLIKPRLRALVQIAHEEKIELTDETDEYYQFQVYCEFRSRRLLATSVTPFVPVSFRIWLRKKTPIVVVFNAGRKLASVGITLLAYATTGNPAAIESLKLDKSAFLRLISWLKENAPDSQIKRITIKKIHYRGVLLRELTLNAEHLEETQLFSEIIGSIRQEIESVITSLSFLTPPLEVSRRRLSCRLNYWGCLTIYTADVSDLELLELIKTLEHIVLEM